MRPRRSSSLYCQWSTEMRRGGLLRPGERVGVAVSGGADSVLLLDFMKQLGEELGLSLAVVHFNHKLRGEESEADERFVRELACPAGGGPCLEFLRAEADVARVARERRSNLEATARELRYRFFHSLVSQGRLDKVATAHTSNDQAETVLLRLLRGAGTRGLGGIYPVLDGKIVRPFLNLTRPEIEAELRARQLNFRLDSTNLNPHLMRNKIRIELLPRLEREFGPRAVRLLKDAAGRARDDEAYLEQQAWEKARPWRVRAGVEERIPVRALAGFPPAISRRVLRQMILTIEGSLRGITHAHIESLRRLASESQSGRSIDLPGGLSARREFEWLCLGRQATIRPASPVSGYSFPVEPPAEVTVRPLGLTFRFKIVAAQDRGNAYNKSGGVYLDPLKLPAGLVLRNWRAGDRFRAEHHGRPRKLKELFRESRIPEAQRKLWPVLESGNDIVWVKGFAPAHHVAATAASELLLSIREEACPPEE